MLMASSRLQKAWVYWRPLVYALLQCIVLMLIAIPHLTCTFLIIPAWYDYNVLEKPRCMLAILCLNIGVFNIYLNYGLACWTDPGRSDHYTPPKHANPEALRRCRHCRIFKAERAHHCRQCGRCVLKMDHHCPWINNCVGYFNHGHFTRFLIWVTLTTGGLFLLLFFRARDVFWEMQGFYLYIGYLHDTTAQELVCLIADITITLAVFIAVGVLMLFQLWNIMGNATTIEGWEQDRVEVMVRRHTIAHYQYPFDIDWLTNMKQVLGPNVLLWLWPQRMKGNGIDYPKHPTMPSVHWPPDEYVIESQDPRHAGRQDDSSSEEEEEQVLMAPQQKHKKKRRKQNVNKGCIETCPAWLQWKSRSEKEIEETPTRVQPRSVHTTVRKRWRRGSEGYIVSHLPLDQ